MLQDNAGFIFGGQLTQYMDAAEIKTIAKAPSGFFSGFDFINSCMEAASKFTFSALFRPDLTSLTADIPSAASIFTDDATAFGGGDGSINTLATGST